MGIQTVHTKIGGHQYKLETFGARQGMTVALLLIRFLGPTMAEAIGTTEAGARKTAQAVQAGLDGEGKGTTGKAFLDAAQAVDNQLGEMLVRGVQVFAATASQKDFDQLVEAFVGKCKLVQPLDTKAGGETLDVQLTLDVFDKHFAGRYRDLIQWLIWCLKENFADFFAGSGNGVPGQDQTPKG